MLFLFQCVDKTTSITIPTFFGKQRVLAQVDRQIKCTHKERKALLDFKVGLLQDPSHHEDCISAWGTKIEDVDDDCCKWKGVKCDNQTGHVTELYLKFCYLRGEISPSLMNLTYLTLVDLRWNSFSGTIPNSIGSLTRLRELYLSGNSLNGIVPGSIGYLTELRHLSFSYNSFNGTIPNSIGALTQLRHLDLSYNSFSGTILKSISSLIELTHLDLSFNSFNDTIPESICSLKKFQYLNLYSNSFSGNIPKCIGFLTELRELYLSHNSLNGTIPLEFENLVNLKRLYLNDLGRCSVESISWLSRLSHLEELFMNGIPLAKGDYWVNVILSLQNLTMLHLDRCGLSQVMHPYSSSSSHVNSSSSSSSNIIDISLSNNNLNSSMYHWLYALTRSNRLQILSLDGNKLDEFPNYLGNLCHLTYLFFNNNSAIISFSDFLKTLSSGCTSHTLVYLEGSSSQFTGSISNDIENFSSLQELYLSHNRLDGTISDKIWELPMLYELSISSNSFKGSIFEKIGKSKIMYIDMSSNDFSGKALDLSTFHASRELDLSANNFSGPVTNVSSTLNLLNLSKNKFYGGISFLCQIVDGSLKFLDLSYNSFSGQIPDCLWFLKNLEHLNLANNNLCGRFPASFEYLIQLDVLNLYNNSFTGELPLSLRNCTKLAFLDLGSNKFSGNMPVWIGENLLGLYVLSLGSNNFFGAIPLQLCQLINLQILDLSMNNLNGTIPSCVDNLTSMVQQESLSAHNLHQYLISTTSVSYTLFESRDYTDNAIVQWQGIRREFTNNLGLLKSFDLSSNNLTGKIPNELTGLYGLLALNLSRNALHGEIPHKIGQVKDLLTLDLSRNQLSGKVPLSISEMSSLSYLEVSYNNLSGRIPSGSQLQTFNATSYTGNAGLCGFPLSKYCHGDQELQGEREGGDGDGENDELDTWYFIGAVIGFTVGFWIVCITLLVISRGRHTFFHYMDTLEDWVKVKLFKAKLNKHE
uniref:receptor-like protein EIX1 n=1 Tax=Erigeron canadensis TaxID=72917 RepID=UPI001CB9A452|nr:receptor-like protein EIX1 [Erigeron canadensis]